jgi:hypothetical protein
MIKLLLLLVYVIVQSGILFILCAPSATMLAFISMAAIAGYLVGEYILTHIKNKTK